MAAPRPGLPLPFAPAFLPTTPPPVAAAWYLPGYGDGAGQVQGGGFDSSGGFEGVLSCGFGTAGLFSPAVYQGGQEGGWMGMVTVPGGFLGKEGEGGGVDVEGPGWEGSGEEESSGSEDSRSSEEKVRKRRGGGGVGKREGRGKKARTGVVSRSSESLSEEGKKKRREMESPVPWTEGMVRFLFETYDDVHRRLWIESRGKVKNQKKWDPIIKTMQEKFGRDFTKNQCESKYWKVRRECARFKSKCEKRALVEPGSGGNGGNGGRELMKPKFYDVWLEVAGNDPVKMPEIELSSGSDEELAQGGQQQEGDREALDEEGKDGEVCRPAKQSVREVKKFLSSHQEASEKREEALNIRAELTMERLREHMDRMEQRGSNIDQARKAQLVMLEGVENKLDRLLHGLTALNGSIGAFVGKLASLPQR